MSIPGVGIYIQGNGSLAVVVAFMVALALGLTPARVRADDPLRAPESCAELARALHAEAMPWPMPRVVLRAAGCS